MMILKKILGIIIILFTILFSSALAYVFPILIENSKKKFEDGLVGAPGYAIGIFICFLFSVVIIYFFIKISLRLIKKKKVNHAIIDQIGLEEKENHM